MVQAGDNAAYVDVARNVYEGGLQLPYLDVEQQFDIQGAAVNGDADIHRLSADRVYGHDAYVRNDFDISRSSIQSGVGLTGTDVRRINGYLMQAGGDIDIRGSTARHVMLQDADIAGRLRFGKNDNQPIIDLRGTHLGGIEDWGGTYSLLLDEDTRIGTYTKPREAYEPVLTENQQLFLEDLQRIPRFPLKKTHGVCFSLGRLREDLVMDTRRLGTLGSLVATGAIDRIDTGKETYYLARTDL